MTLTDLRYITALAETKHFGKAAQCCSVSQPTLSVAIKKLEEDLGVALFERARGNVQVTPQGVQIIDKAKRILQDVQELKELAQATQDPLVGPLAIGTLPTVGPYLLPQCIPLLRSLAPALSLYIEEDDGINLGKKLRAGQLGAAIVALPFSEPDIVVQPLFQEPLVALVPADHPLALKTQLLATDLAPEDMLLLSDGDCLRRHILQAFPHLNGAHNIITGSSIEALRNMVASGLGITLLPMGAAEVPLYAKHHIVLKSFADCQPLRTLALAWRVSYPRHQAIDVLRRAILASSHGNFSAPTHADAVSDLIDNHYW